jgi:hypothetical protein
MPNRSFLRRTLVTGTVAALFSAVTAIAAGRRTRGHPSAPLNAVSHIAWGGAPPAEPGPAGRNAGIGLALHWGAAVFWAAFFDTLFGRVARRSRRGAIAAGVAVSTAAYVTDYHVVSERFRPGYEAYLSPRGLAAVYAVLALGFALGARLVRLHHHEVGDCVERHEGGDTEDRPDRKVAAEARVERTAGAMRRAREPSHPDLDRDHREPAGERDGV